MSEPVFAIAVPIGSWHPLLPAALRSLALQGEFAEIAILDASSDPNVSAAIEASGLKAAYVRRGPDGGQSDAIAEAWENTDAPWVGWLNADDLLLPNTLECVAETIERLPDSDVIFGDSLIIDAERHIIGVHGEVSSDTSLLPRTNCISQPSCFVRRGAVESVGGIDRNLKYTMDWDLWVRLQRRGHRFSYINQFLSAVYWGPGTKTSQLSPDRLYEIASLVARNAGLRFAAVSVFSFLRQALTRSTPERSGAHSGLYVHADYNAREIPRSRITIPALNTSSKPARTIQVKVRGDEVRLSPVQDSSGTWASDGHLVIRLGDPVAPGQAVDLHFEMADPTGSARIAAIYTS